MGFLNWLDKHIRKSNEEFYDSLEKSYNRRQEWYSNESARREKAQKIDCCANCRYYHNGHCDMGIVQYTYGQMETKVPYEKVCSKFSR